MWNRKRNERISTRADNDKVWEERRGFFWSLKIAETRRSLLCISEFFVEYMNTQKYFFSVLSHSHQYPTWKIFIIEIRKLSLQIPIEWMWTHPTGWFEIVILFPSKIIILLLRVFDFPLRSSWNSKMTRNVWESSSHNSSSLSGNQLTK